MFTSYYGVDQTYWAEIALRVSDGYEHLALEYL